MSRLVAPGLRECDDCGGEGFIECDDPDEQDDDFDPCEECGGAGYFCEECDEPADECACEDGAP